MARVLIVDDSSLFRRALAEIVSKKLEVADFAKDGVDALEKFKSVNPDIVLLDVTMPNKDGKACLQDILNENPKAKVIMVSAIKSMDTVNECLEIGAKDFINKSDINIDNEESANQVISKIEEILAA